MKGKQIIKFNNEVVKTLSKKQFVEQHPHVENAEAEYEKIVGKKQTESEK